MKLVMFDMDGTLTDSFSLDENCYVLAIQQALGLGPLAIEWDSFVHTTANYCLGEIVRQHRGTPPTPDELHAVQQRMVGIMAEIQQRHGRRTHEIPGAAACLRALRDSGHAVAIASGDWRLTAHHKLGTAGLPFAGLPAAFGDDAHPRADIMRLALARAAAHYGCPEFERVVYVGDAGWDVRACRELGWPLVAIASGPAAHRLRALGVSHVVPDYRDLGAFLAALDSATAPLQLAS